MAKSKSSTKSANTVEESVSVVTPFASNSKSTGRYHGMILFPDNANHMHVLHDFIESVSFRSANGFRPVFINHVPESDDKKEHYHVMLVFDRKISSAGVRKLLGMHPDKYVWKLYYKPAFQSETTSVGLTSASKKQSLPKRREIYGTAIKPVLLERANETKPVTLPFKQYCHERKDLADVEIDYIPLDWYKDGQSAFSMPVRAVRVYRTTAPVNGHDHIEFTCPDGVPFEQPDPALFNNDLQATLQYALANIVPKYTKDLGNCVSAAIMDVPSIPENYIWVKTPYYYVEHVEKISDPYAYVQYMLHRDASSIDAGKTAYDVRDLQGDGDLIFSLLNRKRLTDLAPLRMLREIIDRKDVHYLTDVLDTALSEGLPEVATLCQDRSHFVVQLLKDKSAKSAAAALEAHEGAVMDKVDLFADSIKSNAGDDSKAKQTIISAEKSIKEEDYHVEKRTEKREFFRTLILGELLKLQASGTPVTPDFLKDMIFTYVGPAYRDTFADEVVNVGLYHNITIPPLDQWLC